MRLGFGGGAFGIRGGISTRGVGVGVGPLSAGTSWGRGCGGGGPGFFAIMIAIAAVLLAFEWPWMLGSWLAVQFGAPNPSTARTVVGRIFEVPWLVFLVAATVVWMQKHAERQAAAAERQATIAEYRAPRAVSAGGGRTVYDHASCTINHRTPDAAARCRNRR